MIQVSSPPRARQVDPHAVVERRPSGFARADVPWLLVCAASIVAMLTLHPPTWLPIAVFGAWLLATYVAIPRFRARRAESAPPAR